MARVAGYGSWRSPITAELVSTAQVGLAQPSLDREIAYWLEVRPDEGGRTVLVRRPIGGARADLTPEPFNVRTRVHEYGGGAYAVRDGIVLAANFADQRLYRLAAGAAAAPLTPESAGRLRYADLEFDPAGSRVFAVREDHRAGGEAINTIVSIGLGQGDDPGRVVAEGHDFFSSPRLCPDRRRLAWLSWDHPDMPWDASRLWLAELGEPEPARAVAGGPRESIVQPAWSPDGQLYFVSDRTGWWNLYRLADDGPVPVCPMSAEFAGPAWAFGLRWYDFLSANAILACFSEGGRWRLARIETATGRLQGIDLPYTEIGGVTVAGGRAILRAGAPDRPAAILLLDPASGAVSELASAGDPGLDPACLAWPEAIEFPSEPGQSAHAFYYPPTNPEFRAPPGARPPLIVKSHGGPTGGTSSELRLCSSTGPGAASRSATSTTAAARATAAYRERLNGRWGDGRRATDCVNARAPPGGRRAGPTDSAWRSRGGSAGGYTTLCALTFHDVFKAGASHYGVSDLEALAQGHPQVREPLSRPPGRALPGGQGALPGALADPPRRAAVLPDHLLPGPGGRGRAAQPGGDDGRGAAAEGPAGRLPDLRGRAARLPQGGDHPAALRAELYLLRPGVRFRAGRPAARSDHRESLVVEI